MAAGTCVLASDIPGYRNVARHDVNAWLVPPDDAEALRAGLRRLLDADDLRDRLVEAGTARVADFSLHRLAERYVEVYEQAISTGLARWDPSGGVHGVPAYDPRQFAIEETPWSSASSSRSSWSC